MGASQKELLANAINSFSGAAVPGRLSLAGTEARPTDLFSEKSCGPKTINISVILNKAQRSENLGGIKKEILRYAQNDKKIVF